MPKLLLLILTLAFLLCARAGYAQEPVVQPLVEDPAGAELANEALLAADDEQPGEFAEDSEEMSAAEQAEYAAALRDFVAGVREKVVAGIASRIEDKQAQRMDTLAGILVLVSLGGVFLLFTPLFLRKRYPNRGAVLFRYSALAALMFFFAVNLFAGVLMVMRGSQAALGSVTNPQIQVVEATFDLIKEKADEMTEIGPLIIEPTLASLTGDSQEPVLAMMLSNVQALRSDFTVFTSVANLFKRLDFLFGLLPIVLLGVTMFLFFQASRPTLQLIIALPGRAASGVQGAGRHALSATLRSVWSEFRATACVIGVLLILSILAGMLVGMVLMPAIEIFLTYLSISMIYVQTFENANSFWVLFSLMASIIFLVVNLAVTVLASAFYLGKAQKLFQARFRDGVPLRRHAHFWKWGSASVVWLLALPVLFISASVPAVGWLAERMIDTGNWPLILGGGPAIFLASFGLVFWFARGGRALGFIRTYNVSRGRQVSGVVEQSSVAVADDIVMATSVRG